MKLDFDPRKNVSFFYGYYAKINKFNDLLVIKSLIKNWQQVILFRIGIIKHFKLLLRSGKVIEIKSLDGYNTFWNSEDALDSRITQLKLKGHKIEINKKDKFFKINKFGKEIRFYFDGLDQAINTEYIIEENYINEQYKHLEVKGRDIVDIGANVGDTAIYFALNGAKHVYAYEPYPYSYHLAQKNIKQNGLSDKITLINEGCGKKGFVKIGNRIKNNGGTSLKSYKEGQRIRVSSLSEILERFNLQHPILKMDCEGCEYSSLLNTKSDILRKFDECIVEYHYGYRNIIKKFLEAGFKINYKLPRLAYYIDGTDKETMYVGIIHAKK